MDHTETHRPAQSKRVVLYSLTFLAIAIIGLTYVKWMPYVGKSITAISTHSIGDSILGSTPKEAESASFSGAWDYAVTYFAAVWKAAVLGILLGSLLQVLLPANWLIRVLGKTSFASTAAGGIAAVPGMMCTCCAAPVAVGLRKKNVSIGSALAFWIGNPTLNPAALVFMTFVLSWKFTALRLVFGIILTFGVSYLANRLAPAVNPVDTEKLLQQAAEEEQGSFLMRWFKSLGKMTLFILPAYFLSVLLMGAVKGWLFPQLGEATGSSILLLVLVAIGGMLFVIPTAAEIPIIQTFMAYGMGGGPAAALLLTLPAISLPSLLLVSKSFPKRVLAFVSVAVVVLGVLAGVAGNYIL
ncbi:permease [Sporosarcina aquimarina]|uniref:Permease n=1 Tax=Sporosarcina aquimarina TaxID=114975 RepID=A0ABU4G0Z9_9BACL|nr:permease [Sporosarcina aquimarina]MDW0110626.1 permease [Sporosarcina aquimarina]